LRKTSSTDVKELDKVYEREEVCGGLFDTISNLKTSAHTCLNSSESFREAAMEYENIMKLCQNAKKIPLISGEKCREILLSIRPNVNDLFSITCNHYRHFGETGITHMQLLINAIIDDLDNTSADELNFVLACLFHKGH